MNYEPIKFSSIEERHEYFVENYMEVLGMPVINKLVDDGFLTAPASTKYHGNYRGGLFDHSVNVAEVLCRLTQQNNLTWQHSQNWDAGDDLNSPKLVGILHDLCKIDIYKLAPSEAQFPYEHDDSPIIKGHGIKSALYLAKYGIIKVTEEELACIIYHMGAYTPAEEWKAYNNAVNKYPNVAFTHLADLIASHVMGV